MSLTVYLGIDVGSVTTKLALVDEKGKYVDSYMLRTAGKPVMAVQKGLNELFAKRITDYDVMGVGTTGSGRNGIFCLIYSICLLFLHRENIDFFSQTTCTKRPRKIFLLIVLFFK